jgi:hypothetical protein
MQGSSQGSSATGPGPPLLHELIETRLRITGLKRTELIRKWGYANISKGFRRLDQLARGIFVPTDAQFQQLASALQLPVGEIRDAFSRTLEANHKAQEEILAEEHRRWRSAFKPHAICTPVYPRPSQIFVVALLGAENLLRIDFDHSRPEAEWVEQVRRKLPDRVAGFGGISGFTLNYGPDRATSYDRSGAVLQTSPKAYRVPPAALFWD